MTHVARPRTSTAPYRVQVLDRTLAILDVLGSQKGNGSLPELCTALRLHKSTVHRLLMALERHGLVDKNPQTGGYRLGLRLFELGSKAISALDLGEHAQKYLIRLQHETEETVNLGLLNQGDILYAAKIEPEKNLRMAVHVGHRYPAYSTAMGKAILAGLPEAEAEAIIRRMDLKARTQNTIATAEGLKAELRGVRARGYAIDNEENELGARCVGAAVWDHMGRPIAAMSVSAPAFRMDGAKTMEMAKALLRAVGDLSREFGYSGTEGGMGRVVGKGA